MERGCLMVTVACVQCADPIVMGPWSAEEVHFLTNEQWGKNLVECSICNACINAMIVAEDNRLDDIDDLAHDDDWDVRCDDLPADADLPSLPRADK